MSTTGPNRLSRSDICCISGIDPSISHRRSQIFAAASVSCMMGTQRGPYPTATSGRFSLEVKSFPTAQMLALNWAFTPGTNGDSYVRRFWHLGTDGGLSKHANRNHRDGGYA